jgi:hypothetical protein
VEADLALDEDEADDDERAGTAAVAAFVRDLAVAGDVRVRNCAEVFADPEDD